MSNSDSDEENSWVVVDDPEDTISVTWKDVLLSGGAPLCGGPLPLVDPMDGLRSTRERADCISLAETWSSEAEVSDFQSTRGQPISHDDAKLLRASKYESTRHYHLPKHTERKKCIFSGRNGENEETDQSIEQTCQNAQQESRTGPACASVLYEERETELAAEHVCITDERWKKWREDTKHYYLKVLGKLNSTDDS